jgi:hypothetical protein
MQLLESSVESMFSKLLIEAFLIIPSHSPILKPPHLSENQAKGVTPIGKQRGDLSRKYYF